jgi:hypothetical protein
MANTKLDAAESAFVQQGCADIRCTGRSIALSPFINGVISDTLEWTQVQRDIVHLVELLYAMLLSVMNNQTDLGRQIVFEFLQKLAEMPEGWRIATLLRDVDQQWGHKLECKGIEFDTIIRQQKKGA